MQRRFKKVRRNDKFDEKKNEKKKLNRSIFQTARSQTLTQTKKKCLMDITRYI